MTELVFLESIPMVSSIPMLLVALRIAIAPFLLWDSLDGQVGTGFLVAYVVAVLSDIFDGVIARRLGVSTAGLRQADSWADRLLYVCIAIAAWLTHRDIILTFQVPLLTVLGLQALWWVINLVKYGQPACYHTYTAKAWGLSLLVATLMLFGASYGGWALGLAIALGIIHTLEEIAMTLILPTWQHDIPSLFHAWKLRQQPSIQP
ncbi:CDP-alcohol phosphatidyltransferase family protein [Leptolyngbya sp. PL-A3]|uniref:CDP-alcohol phosphatidyltransferase family protein n=1 Tax=Leptolyngbya sp. PL-A3 TaxID=2933911 RepID=UPI003297EC31